MNRPASATSSPHPRRRDAASGSSPHCSAWNSSSSAGDLVRACRVETRPRPARGRARGCRAPARRPQVRPDATGRATRRHDAGPTARPRSVRTWPMPDVDAQRGVVGQRRPIEPGLPFARLTGDERLRPFGPVAEQVGFAIPRDRPGGRSGVGRDPLLRRACETASAACPRRSSRPLSRRPPSATRRRSPAPAPAPGLSERRRRAGARGGHRAGSCSRRPTLGRMPRPRTASRAASLSPRNCRSRSAGFGSLGLALRGLGWSRAREPRRPGPRLSSRCGRAQAGQRSRRARRRRRSSGRRRARR